VAARGETAPQAVAPPRTRNLPLQLSGFIGRQREVETLTRRLLQPDVRLLTLTGPGGTGKTRLALEVAEQLVDHFADGVYFVDLSAIVDPELVVFAVAQGIGVSEIVGQPLADSLQQYLRDKQALLVLDNFEQVALAAPLAPRLLVACPKLKALATSRVLLRVSGEHAFSVPPLTLPHPGHQMPVDDVDRYEAVRLFVVRAQAVKPGFAITRENAPSVVEICNRLDGLPLAIELAAARARLLSPHALVARLGNRLALLTGGVRDLPAKQQTLRAALDWSYDLLRREEQRLLAQFGVFVSGCDMEAAEAVCGSPDGPDVFEGISSLLSSSLLRQQERPHGVVRFGMLETIREYALARLAESGDAATVARRHAEYYLGLAETADQELAGLEQAEWLGRLEEEHDNLRAALGWTGDHDEMEMALRLCAALWVFWSVDGYVGEGCRWLEKALARSDGAPSPARARALNGAGLLAWKQGDFERGKGYLEESLRVYRELGDREGAAAAVQTLGATMRTQGRHAQAKVYFEQSLQLHSELGAKRGISYALRELGMLYLRSGEDARAEQLCEQSLELQREIGDEQAVVGTLSWLGLIALARADYARASLLQEESLALAHRLGTRALVPVPVEAMGLVAWKRGDYARATELFEESLELWREFGGAHNIGWCLTSLAVVALEQEAYERAATLAAQGLELLRQAGAEEGMAECLEILAAVEAARERPAVAAQLFGAVEALRQAIGVIAPPIFRPSYEQFMSAARTQLGEKKFTAAWAAGREMTPE
jgi:predicted ATPase